MKKLAPIFIVLLILAGASYFLLFNSDSNQNKESNFKLEEFDKVRSCVTLPRFLYNLNIRQPIIDLSQNRFKGVAFYYGRGFNKVLHKKSWERFDALGTYIIDNKGDIYLTPNPFISIKDNTFSLQKAIYKLSSNSGELSKWLEVKDVTPNASNPYGLISITFDCDSGYLYASAIDKSNYKGSRGRVYKINPKDKSYNTEIDNFDALTITTLKSKSSKYLLAGNALDNSLYAFKFSNGELENKPHKLLTIPNPELHIRKIKVTGKNNLKLEAIKFKYSLVAETNKKQRYIYDAKYNPKNGSWKIKEIKE